MTRSTCISGGAEGADEYWGLIAKSNGHAVIHYTFAGHKSRCSDIVILNHEELIVADPFLIRANKSVKRTFPAKSQHTNNLLRRNYYQIKDSLAVYGVGYFDEDDRVQGGTAWAIQIMLDRMLLDKKAGFCYFFEQTRNQWLQFVPGSGWVPTLEVRKPQGKYAGIGTRRLMDNGERAIENVYKGKMT